MTLPGYNSFSRCLSVSTPFDSEAVSLTFETMGIETVLEGGLESASTFTEGDMVGARGGDAGCVKPSI